MRSTLPTQPQKLLRVVGNAECNNMCTQWLNIPNAPPWTQHTTCSILLGSRSTRLRVPALIRAAQEHPRRRPEESGGRSNAHACSGAIYRDAHACSGAIYHFETISNHVSNKGNLAAHRHAPPYLSEVNSLWIFNGLFVTIIRTSPIIYNTRASTSTVCTVCT